MPANSLLQIVSGFKPDVDGMGDFGRLLGSALWARKSIRTHFVAYRRPKSPIDLGEIFPNTISYLPEPSPEALAKHLADLSATQKFDAALVHYGAYGYSREGKPAAFGKVVEELSRRIPVFVFFHEIHATAMPWKRAFWTYPEQRRCALGLVRIAKASFTSNSEYVRTLESFKVPGAVIKRAPVISNVGELADPKLLNERERHLVIFGQFSNRLRIYEKHQQALVDICKLLRIRKVVDVGSGESPHIPDLLDGVPLERAGWMGERQLSSLLAGSIAGLVCYTPDIWEKSGVIAAYQAHAVVPILIPMKNRVTPEPEYLPYVSVGQLRDLAGPEVIVSDDELQSLASAAHHYYASNQSLDYCVEDIGKSILASSSH